MKCHYCKKKFSPDQLYTVCFHIKETPVFERTVCQSCLPLIAGEYKSKSATESTEEECKPCLH